MKILLLVFMSEIKIDLTLKRLNFLFLLCFKVAIILERRFSEKSAEGIYETEQSMV